MTKENYEFNLGFNYDPMKPDMILARLRDVANQIERDNNHGIFPKSDLIYSGDRKIVGSWAVKPKEE